MKTIDLRCKPTSISGFQQEHFDANWASWYNSFDRLQKRAAEFNSYPAESVRQQSVEMLLNEMDEIGIEMAVNTQARRWGSDEETQAYMQLMEEYPGRFGGIIGANPGHVEEALADIDKYVIDGPFLGVHIEPHMPYDDMAIMDYDDERIFPIYEKMNEQHIPLFLTYGPPHDKWERNMPSHIETIARTFPDMKIGLTHGAWPWFQQICSLMYYLPNIYVVCDYFIMKLPGWRDYADAANSLWGDRICFSSNYPVNSQRRVHDFFVYEAGFRDDVLPKVMHDNALTLLGLTAHLSES